MIRKIYNTLFPENRYKNVSYSQEGEDLVLNRCFGNKKTGFYLDIGAHHPVRFSNTYLFYLRGWKGINIDAMPGSMKIFDKIRPLDINIECPVSDTIEKLTYYIFNEPALNTFSEEESQRKNGLADYKIIDEKTLTTNTLSNILSKYLPPNTPIDFMSIDVEGLDLQVLKSNNWELYKPEILLVEELFSSSKNLLNQNKKNFYLSIEEIIEQSDIYLYLKNRGYKIFAKTGNTTIYRL
ncbi:MAG: FkbM family methyltransferase [Chitinophagaceae bacterium]|nr:FkbM family methyltransferase [Chitinophagaceae bacterium]